MGFPRTSGAIDGHSRLLYAYQHMAEPTIQYTRKDCRNNGGRKLKAYILMLLKFTYCISVVEMEVLTVYAVLDGRIERTMSRD